jgi:hypothetical protein
MLNNIQERVERSIFERVRLILVEEGYTPDVADDLLYPKDGEDLSIIGQANYTAALQTITTIKGFAIELFSTSTSFAKGLKKIPRIVINPQRVITGEIGLNPGGTYNENPLLPGNFIKTTNPLESANLQLDFHLVSGTTKQMRVLIAVLQRAIGQKVYLKMYDNANDRFFIKQYNYYNLPDPPEGISEDIYSYEVQDLFIFDETPVSSSIEVSKIIEITNEIEENSEILNQTVIV